MIFVHELRALNLKSADIESVPIIRALREKVRLPVTEEQVFSDFAEFMVKRSDLEIMEKTAEIIPQAMQEIIDLSKKSQNLEQINLKRVYTNLQEIQTHLQANIQFVKLIFSWQFPATGRITGLINRMPSLKTKDDKMKFNSDVSPIFETILRNKNFNLAYGDIVYEAHREGIKTIIQSMEEGTFFHVEVDEQLKKTSFSVIRKRLQQDELEIFDSIAAKTAEIKKGVDTAYDINTRMIRFAVQLYSYMKWLDGF